MLKLDQKTLDHIEGMYPGFKEQVYRFENADLPNCSHCGSDDTANVQVGVIGRTMYLVGATTKFKLIPNGPKPGDYFCNQCAKFSSNDDLKNE